jgi:transposase InsO family protein
LCAHGRRSYRPGPSQRPRHAVPSRCGTPIDSPTCIAPSVGNRGDAYDNALAESVIGLFKTEVIQRLGPWRHLDSVEYATLTWIDWFNTRRLLEPIAYVPQAEFRGAVL